MKPPPGTTIVATPVANCWFDHQLLCVDNLNCRRTISNTTAHYDILTAMAGGRKVQILSVFPACETFSPAAQSLAAARLAPICLSMAVVTLPVSVPALAYSFRLLARTVPVKVLVKEAEARRWLYLNS